MQVSASTSASASRPVQRDNANASDVQYTVRRGDTLGAIAQRFGTDVSALVARNGIRNANLIHPGQRLTIPSAGMQFAIVARGDTLAGIAAQSGVSVAQIVAANPQIRNANLIFPGDRVAIPAGTTTAPATSPREPSAPRAVDPVGETRLSGGTLRLTQTDIVNIKKTLQTEWVQTAGDAQAHGIIDTILNRTASGRWGDSVSDVVNARYQFSDINGPVSWGNNRTSVEQIPMSRVSGRVDRLVDAYLAERAGGRPSSIGTHLNYANPHYSSPRNLGWIMALDGPVLGSGRAIHRHGTTPDLERHRPDAFALALPGTAATAPPAAGPALPNRPFDGRAVAAANGVEIKGASVNISRLQPEMAPVIAAVADAARQLGLPTPVITSGNDSRHSSGSLHYSNAALDFRGRNISIAQGNALREAVQRALGPGYDVLFETFPDSNNNHLHVEFDPN